MFKLSTTIAVWKPILQHPNYRLLLFLPLDANRKISNVHTYISIENNEQHTKRISLYSNKHLLLNFSFVSTGKLVTFTINFCILIDDCFVCFFILFQILCTRCLCVGFFQSNGNQNKHAMDIDILILTFCMKTVSYYSLYGQAVGPSVTRLNVLVWKTSLYEDSWYYHRCKPLYPIQ